MSVGLVVQTPLGRGIVRQLRGRGRVLVEVNGRAVELDERALTPVDPPSGRIRKKRVPAPEVPAGPPAGGGEAFPDVDLHGLTVEEAMSRVDRVLNDALLSDAHELRLIHGRSGGRIRGALHRRLAAIPTVRAFRLDPRNAGVTIVNF